MNHLIATIIFGLSASLCWGSGDFCGGLASRRANVLSVVIGDYTVGFALLALLALLSREPSPSPADLLWGGLAGVAGVLGLIAFYSALATGQMGITAPISAVLTAALPVLFSALTTGLPSLLQLVGFVLALLAIGLISRPERADGSGPPKGVGLAVLAGCGFGCFFILLSRVSPGHTFWPLAVARLISVSLMLIVALLMRLRLRPAAIRRQATRPAGAPIEPMMPGIQVAPFVVLAGILDAVGNAFFVLAAHSGRLDVAAILSSFYPAATVLLAALVLRERVTRMQGVGILLVLLAVPAISA